jgi:DNA-binding transcriptional ArsR family regulator
MGEYSAGTLDRVFSAVSDATRRAILARLAGSDGRVTDVASAFPISLNSTSKHIRVLEGAGLVRRRVRGARAHLEPGCGTTRRSGRMDRALPQLLERSARLARRLRHRGSTWSYLDMTALGRQEAWEDSPDGYPQTPPYEWWIWHDEPRRTDPDPDLAASQPPG